MFFRHLEITIANILEKNTFCSDTKREDEARELVGIKQVIAMHGHDAGLKKTEGQFTMTTGMLSLETETRTSFWVATNHLHFGGGSEVFAIVLRFVDRTNNAPIVLFDYAGLGLGTKSANPHSIVRLPQSVDKEHKQKAFVSWIFSSETGPHCVAFQCCKTLQLMQRRTCHSKSD